MNVVSVPVSMISQHGFGLKTSSRTVISCELCNVWHSCPRGPWTESYVSRSEYLSGARSLVVQALHHVSTILYFRVFSLDCQRHAQSSRATRISRCQCTWGDLGPWTSPFRYPSIATASVSNLNIFYQEPTRDVFLSPVHVTGWRASQIILSLSTWTCLAYTTLPQVYYFVEFYSREGEIDHH